MRFPIRRLWWLDPAWPFATIVGSTILAAHLQSEAAYQLYRTPKYVQGWHLLLAAGAILAFVLGTRLATATGRIPQPTPPSSSRIVQRWFSLMLALTAFGYAAWLAIGVKNGFSFSLFVELLTTDDPELADWIRQDLFATVPGVTTCTQFGVPAAVLGLWLYFHGYKRVLGPLVLLIAVATVRSILFSERTAIIEMLAPAALIVLRMSVLGRPLPRWCGRVLRAAPLVAPVAVVLFFGGFEYFRSWRFYHTEFDSYTEFTVWRLSGYYTTAHNNGAMTLETAAPRILPYNTLRSFWLFPGISKSPLAYDKLTGRDAEADHLDMLHRHGNFELNNEGGLFQPTLDYGIAGGMIFWFGYGILAGRLYRSFMVGTIAGLTVYPLVYLSILEVPLVLFLCYSRMFPAFVVLAGVAWTTRPHAVARANFKRDPGVLAGAL